MPTLAQSKLCAKDIAPALLDRLLEIWISDRVLDDQIDGSSEDTLQGFFEIEISIEQMSRFPVEADQDINVTIGPQLIGGCRTENVQSLDIQPPADFSDG
jgi:hypothetical protein